MHPAERFWQKVDASLGPEECWVWTGGRFGAGHGRFGFNQAAVGAHRWLMSELAGRWLDSDEVVCHKCDNPPCCNPSHLYIGTKLSNAQDREARGRSGSGRINAAKTCCPYGHEYTVKNTFVKAGSRNCRECARLRAPKYKVRSRVGGEDR